MNIRKLLPIARNLTWVSYSGLLLSLLANGLYQSAPVVIQGLRLAPLLIFIPGMISQNHKTLAMLCLVCLMYFTLITVNLFEASRTGFDIMEMAWVVMLFASALLFSRWRQRSLREHLENSEN